MTRMFHRFGRLIAPTAMALWALGSMPAHANPNFLTVQGHLTNQAGTAINGTYAMKFSLYTAQSGGTLLWEESQTGILVNDGIFDDVLGDVNPVANPLRVDFFRNNPEVWLQIQLQSGPGVAPNEAPLPRQRLATSAYTFVAHHAATATSATSASTATTATTANTAATATSALGLACNPACVAITELDFDPATQLELNNAIAGLVSTTALNTTLGNYVTSASLTTTLGNYATTASLANYATTASLSAYVTTADMNSAISAALQPYSNTAAMNSAISTALQPYSTTAQMNTAISSALTGLVTSSALNTAISAALQPYATTTSVTNAINTALSGYATNASVTSAINTALQNYSTTTAMNAAITNALGGYATTAAVSTSISTALQNYSTTTQMNAAIGAALTNYATNTAVANAITAALTNYATTTSVNTSISNALTSYVTASALSAALTGYARTADIPTSIAGLTGGTVTGNVTSTGTVSGVVVKQNGQVVCDESGNCGRTMDDFTCPAGQVLVKTADDWECQVADGGVPPGECVGAGKVLQWDGAAWQCVNMYNSSLSGGQANGYEARDDWGDAWDGVPRSPRTWAEANQACIDDGARLPTVTELWRNRASWGTGNISTQNDNFYLWTIGPYETNTAMIVYLSNNTRSNASVTSRYPFRCIWKSQKPTGFSGNRCFGPPGSECQSKDSFYNIDKWSRAPQYFQSAKRECELENAAIMTAEDYESYIHAGTTFVNWGDDTWSPWHWTIDSNYYPNGYNYLRILNWVQAVEPWWSATAARANQAGAGSFYAFRCIGKKQPNLNVAPATPTCQGNDCFTITTPSRNRLIADNQNRTAAVWHTAHKACRAAGGYLPTMAEVNQLIQAGWQNGPEPAAYLWSASPATWGWQLYRWRGTGAVTWSSHYDYGPNYYTGSASGPATAYPYRCVWRETEVANWTSCTATQVQMRNEATGAYSCVDKVNGNPNGQQNPTNFPPFVDDWGNAFDFNQRAAATYPVAKAACEQRGGRLPLATELFRVRYNQGLAINELGQSGTATQDYLWTLNPDYRENFQIQIRLSDGGTTAVASNGAATAPYRCIWPATKPEAFSGHACYGLPSDPCYTNGRIRTDRIPRASLPQAGAQFECRFLGGRLPRVREMALLYQGGLPGGANSLWEWTSEWSYWNDGGTYIYYTSRGTNAAQADWQANNSLNELSWAGFSTFSRFRCVFTDVMD